MAQWFLFILVGLVAGLAAGCASSPEVKNTRLQAADLVAMTDQMTASLANSDWLAGRTSASPVWVVSMDRVSNLTNEIIPEREKWAFVARLRAQLGENDGLLARNVRFVLSRGAADRLAESVPTAGDRLAPTHVMTSTFYAATQYSREARTDTYLCTYQLFEVGGEAVLWEDSYEVKRGVVLNRFD